MNDVLNDKAWPGKMMYIIRINQWDNSFGTSNLLFGTSRMLTFYTARRVQITNKNMPTPEGYVLCVRRTHMGVATEKQEKSYNIIK